MNPGYLFGMLGCVLFGAADLAGGIGAKRASAPVVTWISCFAALIVLFVGLPLVPGVPTAADLAWGAAGGVCGIVGASLIYRSLALGPAVVASPVFCLVGLIVPVVFGLAIGERPSPRAAGGIGLAAVSIPLLAQAAGGAGGHSREHIRRTVLVAVLAGLVVGWFLICVAKIGAGAGLWPLIVARATAIAVFGVWFLASRRSVSVPPESRAFAIGAGLCDSLANVCYWLAVRWAPIALVATLVSMAPAVTVLLARAFLGERWSPPQRWGFALALIATGLISLG